MTEASRKRYLKFLGDYRARRLDDEDEGKGQGQAPSPGRKAKRREYLRDYLRWLRPHRYAIAGVNPTFGCEFMEF